MSEIKVTKQGMMKMSSSITFLGVFNFSLLLVSSFIFYNFLDDLFDRFPLYINNLGIFLFIYLLIDLFVNINFLAVFIVVSKNFKLLVLTVLFTLSSYLFRYSLASSFGDYTTVKLDSYATYGFMSTILFGLILQEIYRSLYHIKPIREISILIPLNIIVGIGLFIYLLEINNLPLPIRYFAYIAGLSKIFLLPFLSIQVFMTTGNKLRKLANSMD